MKIMKKFISAILTVALIIGLLPGMTITASASTLTEGDIANLVDGNYIRLFETPEDWQESVFKYALLIIDGVETRNATIVRYTGSGGNVVIPSTIDGYPVVMLDEGVFRMPMGHANTTLTSVTIPDSVIIIGKSVFNGCVALTSVTIGNSVIKIGDSAFESCRSLTNVTIPNSVTHIGERAFLMCSLTSVTIPGRVTYIGVAAFQSTALENVTIPNSVTYIGNLAFDFNVTIRGYENSTAQTYARDNNIKFELIGGAATPPPPPTQEIKVLVGGAAVTFDQPPIIENGRTLVPLRAIFEALGATVEWEQSTQTVTAVKDDITITLKIGDAFLTKNGERIALDVPGKLVGGRTLVPARAVAESFGADVQWDQATRTVTITE